MANYAIGEHGCLLCCVRFFTREKRTGSKWWTIEGQERERWKIEEGGKRDRREREREREREGAMKIKSMQKRDMREYSRREV